MALIPTDPVRPGPDVADLLEGMSRTGFQGRRLGESFRIWSDMIRDPDCTILLGLSGAMIPAGMQQVLITLAERHYIDAIVSTGANIFHDLCEHFGIHHYLGSSHADDADLLRQGIDRIYDVSPMKRSPEIGSHAALPARSPFSGSSAAFIVLVFAIRESRPADHCSDLCQGRHPDIYPGPGRLIDRYRAGHGQEGRGFCRCRPAGRCRRDHRSC
jgi:deoxyhypusine synthase